MRNDKEAMPDAKTCLAKELTAKKTSEWFFNSV